MDIKEIKEIISRVDLNRYFLQCYLKDKLEFTFPLSMAKGKMLQVGKYLLVQRILLKSGESTLENQVWVDPITSYNWKLSGLSQTVKVEGIPEDFSKILDELELKFNKKKKSTETETPSSEIDEDLD